jgi:ABC-type Zn2+ transport system substrate-binding protein/surface adhesin
VHPKAWLYSEKQIEQLRTRIENCGNKNVEKHYLVFHDAFEWLAFLRIFDFIERKSVG